MWVFQEMRTTRECERLNAGVSSDERASEKGRETKERKRGGDDDWEMKFSPLSFLFVTAELHGAAGGRQLYILASLDSL